MKNENLGNKRPQNLQSAICNLQFAIFLLVVCFTNSFGIEIQVIKNGSNNGTANNGIAGGNVVGFVDMDKIFHEYPETQRAMLDYQKEISKKREEISGLEGQLLELKQKKAVMENTFSVLPENQNLAESTTTVNAVSLSTATLSEMNSQIEEQEESLVVAKARVERELAEMEERRSLSILGKIYKALEKLAETEGVDVVVDKSSVLYGNATVDLTEKLQKRLRGE